MVTLEGKINDLILSFSKINAIQFGSFKLKSGLISPIYFDLRLVISYPQILNTIGDIIWQTTEDKLLEFDVICGVPYTALPIATIVSVKHEVPMVLKRKEQKSYGTGKILEGIYKQGSRCLVLEDVVTTGSSVIETVEVLQQHGLIVTDVIVILDREQGARKSLEAQGITMHSLIEVNSMLEFLQTNKLLSPEKVTEMRQFLNNSKLPEISFDGFVKMSIIRKILCPVSKQLVEIMLKKKTNLCLSADLDNWKDVLEIAQVLGPQICVLKTHVDSLNFENFDEVLNFRIKLVEFSEKFEFLILEDRKFADIGSTVQKQLKGKPFEIHKWAHLVTAHGIPGPGILESLKNSVGVVLIAEMSSEGNLATIIPNYKSEIHKMVEGFESVVAGFVSQSSVKSNSSNYFLQFTPGVSIQDKGDGLGQQYSSIDDAISKRGADIIIVGRGIFKNTKDSWISTAEKYKTEGWKAWNNKIFGPF